MTRIGINFVFFFFFNNLICFPSLWCICRQPHNNRFMICCDKCEDWFHGKCVNVTKAMGVEMEERGVEWVCPSCVKKQNMQALGIKVSLIYLIFFAPVITFY